MFSQQPPRNIIVCAWSGGSKQDDRCLGSATGIELSNTNYVTYAVRQHETLFLFGKVRFDRVTGKRLFKRCVGSAHTEGLSIAYQTETANDSTFHAL